MIEKEKGIIGLGMRAGKIAFGTENVLEAIRKRKAKLVIVAGSVSENTKKTLFDKSAFYSVKAEETALTAEELGKAIGKRITAAVAFTDASFVTAYAKAKAENNADFGKRE